MNVSVEITVIVVPLNTAFVLICRTYTQLISTLDDIHRDSLEDDKKEW